MQPISKRRVYLCTFSAIILLENIIRNNLMSDWRLNFHLLVRARIKARLEGKFPLALFVPQPIQQNMLSVYRPVSYGIRCLNTTQVNRFC